MPQAYTSHQLLPVADSALQLVAVTAADRDAAGVGRGARVVEVDRTVVEGLDRAVVVAVELPGRFGGVVDGLRVQLLQRLHEGRRDRVLLVEDVPAQALVAAGRRLQAERALWQTFKPGKLTGMLGLNVLEWMTWNTAAAPRCHHGHMHTHARPH